MLTQFSRTELLFGKEAMEKLKNARVAVFGIGGVGGYVCEALVRSGVGAFDLIDDDKVCLTNINRQIIATRKTVGKYKVDVMKERMEDINPDVDVRVHKCFFLPENADEFAFDEYDYVVDAVDTVTAKISLVMKCKEAGVPIISSMGAGNKLDASQFKVADLSIDLVSRKVSRAGNRIVLTSKEFSLLEFFIRHQGEVLPRSLIASQVWDMNFDSDTNAIDVAVKRLRAKIDNDYGTKLIQTVRGVGYMLEIPDA